MHTSRLFVALGAIAVVVSGAYVVFEYGRRPIHATADYSHGPNRAEAQPPADTGVAAAVSAYNSGNYRQAEANALAVIRSSRGLKDTSKRRIVANARYILAFSTARRGDRKLARERFAALRDDARLLPDRGKTQAVNNEMATTLEEEGAFQHAVLTVSIGDHVGGARELRRFMLDYPASALVHGAVLRLERMNHGNLTREDESAWRTAQRVGTALRMAEERRQSMCAPECLAELIRRRGGSADVETLARKMSTSTQGTTMAALVRVANQYGYRARGLALTKTGLRAQKLPVIALVSPGHFVVVDEARWSGLQVWDPTPPQYGRSRTRWYGWDRWERVSRGLTVAVN
jgi:hypothetical protein